MPEEPLIDPAALAEARVLASREDVQRVIAQRGRFAMLDGILDVDPSGITTAGFKEIRTDDWWAPDHVPGRPIFPGVLMCEAAAQLASYDYLTKHPPPMDRGGSGFLGFAGMDATRFRGVVQPACRMIFVARPVKLRSRMFTYSAQGFVEGKLVFETEIIGTLV
jgi:3-hydroxyacyl-[acyl-carrier-protein] dehydratase